MDKVIIHVRGGIAEVVSQPAEVEVVIVDWDNEDEDNYCIDCGEPIGECICAEGGEASG